MNLRIPGPTPVPDNILQAMAGPMINHRGPEFKELMYRVTDRLKQVFETAGDLYVLTTSGTGAMEAAIANTMSPGDRALCVSVGVFGDRFGEIAEAYGAQVTYLRFPLGTDVDIDRLRETLHEQEDVGTVLVTHNETSTGVTNDLEAMAKVIKGEFDKLLLVDGISSVSSIPISTDAWGCDVVATGSQKGWMMPPGLAFLSFSARAWEAHATAAMPRFYFDMAAYKRYYEMGQPPYTPSVSAFFALDTAVGEILDEGLGTVYERHATIGALTRDGLRSLGLEILPEERCASNTVTAVRVPEGIDGVELVSTLRRDHDLVVAGGQKELTGKILRIGHMGYCTPDDIQAVLTALEAALKGMAR